MAIQNLRSSSAHKRPIAEVLSAGQIAINTNQASPGLFFKDSNGDLVKVGPVHIGTSAPNSSPATTAADALVSGTVYQILTLGTTDFTAVGASANTVGVVFTATGAGTGTGTVSGQQGNEKGEQWLDTTGGTYVLKIWDGTAWRSESGTFVDVSGDTMTGALILPSGTAAAPALGVGSTDNGIYSPGTDQVAISTNGTAAVTVDASQRVGIGTASPATKLEITHGNELGLLTSGPYNFQAKFESTDSEAAIVIEDSNSTNDGNRIGVIGDNMAFTTANTESVRIDSSGNVGIGTTSPTAKLDIEGSSSGEIGLHINNTSGPTSILTSTGGSYSFAGVGANTSWLLTSGDTLAIGPYSANGIIKFVTNSAERMRIDSSGRMLVGTSSARSNLYNNSSGVAPQIQLEGTSFVTSSMMLVRNSADGNDTSIILGKTRGTSTGANTVVSSGDGIGAISFQGADGSELVEAASIQALIDGTPGTNDMPGRLVFSTTADGASSPTERMRINSAGKVLIGKTNVAAGSTSGLEMIGSANDTNYTFAVYDATGTDRVISVRNDNNLVSTTAYGRTTSSGANMNIDSAGFIRRSTSSAKYKTNVETIEDSYSQAILDCRPVWYRSISDGDNPQWGWWGFIAEEVAEIDPRLVQWKTTKTERNENNEIVDIVLDNPEPEGVQYDRFVPHLLNLIKRQKEQIEAMEARLSALEAS